MRIVCGTSGYDYPEWVGDGRFYPPSLASQRGAWLTYYASQFPIVELNFTYYGETSPKQLEGMLRRVDPRMSLSLIEGEFRPRADFSFTIKAYASLTHQIGEEWRVAAAKFRADIAPLAESGKLCGVLAQFPSRFGVSGKTLGYALGLAEALAPLKLLAEFRHADWLREKPRRALLDGGVTVCGVDAPLAAGMPSVFSTDETRFACGADDTMVGQASSLPTDTGNPATRGAAPPSQPPLRYIRLHGRREETWWSGDAASRYDYRYSREQLEQLALKISEASVETTYALFNNHRQASAARNARDLQEIVDKLLNRQPDSTG